MLDVFQLSATEQLGVNKSVINMLLKSSLKTKAPTYIFVLKRHTENSLLPQEIDMQFDGLCPALE